MKQSNVLRSEAAPSPIADEALVAACGGEGLSLNYGHIEWTYTTQKAEALPSADVTAKWSVARSFGA
jgi:type VI protein secretion system component Hcp